MDLKGYIAHGEALDRSDTTVVTVWLRHVQDFLRTNYGRQSAMEFAAETQRPAPHLDVLAGELRPSVDFDQVAAGLKYLQAQLPYPVQEFTQAKNEQRRKEVSMSHPPVTIAPQFNNSNIVTITVSQALQSLEEHAKTLEEPKKSTLLKLLHGVRNELGETLGVVLGSAAASAIKDFTKL